MAGRTPDLLTLVGKRFACDFEVLGIGPGPQALLLMRGERYLISTDELLTIIERGLVTEVPPGPRRPRRRPT